MEQLSGLDTVMVLGELPNTPLHLSALFIYDPSTAKHKKFDFDQFTTLMNQMISNRLPILKCRLDELPLSIDKPYWVEDKFFDIGHHIHRYALPTPSNWAEIYKECEDFHAQPLDRARPLWQAMLIEGLNHIDGIPKGAVAVLIKIHHSVVDGNTAMRLFANLHALSNEPNAALIDSGMNADKQDFTPPSVFEKYSMAYKHLLSEPIELGIGITKLARNIFKSPELKEEEATEVPQIRFNFPPDPDRVVGHIKLPKDVIKEIRAKIPCTVNDIALTVVGGAMRRYLEKRYELPEEDLITGMPIDVRQKSDSSGNGNHLSFANLSLHSNIEDPLDRLTAIHKTSTAIKKRNKLLGPETLMSLVENIYPSLLQWGGEKIVNSDFIDLIPPINNTIVTNVPGINTDCYLCGAKLVDYLGFGPLPPTLKLFHVVSSVEKHVNISFLSCKSGIDDKKDYQQCLAISFQDLVESVAKADHREVDTTKVSEQET